MTTDPENQTLQQFISSQGLTMTAKRINSNPNMSDWKDARHWSCIIRKPKPEDAIHHDLYKLVIPFSQGSAHTDPPTIEDVLDCMASDASGYDNARSFEDWCSEYGYDTDSRKTESTFNVVKDQAEELKSFLGNDTYDSLLWHTERQ